MFRRGNAKLFLGLPFLWDKRYHKNSVLPNLWCMSVQVTSSQDTRIRSHSPSNPAPHRSGERGVTTTSDCTRSKARGTPCENTLPFPTNNKSFVCFLMTQSLVSGVLLWAIPFIILSKKSWSWGLLVSPTPNWDVPNLTSFLAPSSLMWILVLCTGLIQAQLLNSLTRQIKKSLPDSVA